ncbi:protease B nonderepressible form, partial [Ascosphaera atra]
STCSLHAYLTLPSAIFADKYQLSTADAIYLDSHNLKSLQSITGELDLEAPDWTLSKWGSSHLLELATQRRNPDGGLDATVPLHLRYLHPSPSGYRNVSVPWPVVFWACSGTKKEASPFDRKHLGYDALFEPNTLFYNLHPQPKLPVAEDESGPLHSLLMENIQVPVLAISGDGAADWWHLAGGIEVATVAAVCAGFFWVLYKLCRIAVQPKTGRGAAVGSDKKTN